MKKKMALLVCIMLMLSSICVFASSKNWSGNVRNTWYAHHGDGVWPVVTYTSLNVLGDYSQNTSTVSTSSQKYYYIITMPLYENFGGITASSFQNVRYYESNGNYREYAASHFNSSSGISLVISSDTIDYDTKADYEYHAFPTPNRVTSQVTLNWEDAAVMFQFADYSWTY